MPRTNGVYAPPASSWYPAVDGVDATAGDWNDQIDDVSTALTQSIATDGSSTITDDIPMSGQKLTGLGAGSTNGDSVRYEQLTALLGDNLTAIKALTFADNSIIDLTGAGACAVISYATLLTNIGAVPTSRTVTAGTGLTGGGDLSADRSFAVDIASAANFRANTADKILDTDGVWSAADAVALTDAATVAVDFSTGFNFTLTIGGNRTLGQPSNVKVGQSGMIQITQGGGGSHTLAYHADWYFAGGTDPTLSTGAGDLDLLFYQVMPNGKTFGTLVKDVG